MLAVVRERRQAPFEGTVCPSLPRSIPSRTPFAYDLSSLAEYARAAVAARAVHKHVANWHSTRPALLPAAHRFRRPPCWSFRPPDGSPSSAASHPVRALAMAPTRGQSNQDLLTAALRALVERFRLQGQRLGDVSAGAVIKHSQRLQPDARVADVRAGSIRRRRASTCSAPAAPSLEAAILDRQQDRARPDRLRASPAASTPSATCRWSFRESLSRTAAAQFRAAALGQRLAPWLELRPRDLKPVLPAVVEPRTGLSMGQSCELMAKTGRSRAREQDQLALESHTKAAAAWTRRVLRRPGRRRTRD